MTLLINGKKYMTVESGIFTEFRGFPAKVVAGVNTISGESVVVQVNGEWHFVNKSIQ